MIAASSLCRSTTSQRVVFCAYRNSCNVLFLIAIDLCYYSTISSFFILRIFMHNKKAIYTSISCYMINMIDLFISLNNRPHPMISNFFSLAIALLTTSYLLYNATANFYAHYLITDTTI